MDTYYTQTDIAGEQDWNLRPTSATSAVSDKTATSTSISGRSADVAAAAAATAAAAVVLNAAAAAMNI